MIDRIFWVTCPQCGDKFYCDYSLRYASAKLICPFCQNEFDVRASPKIDDRWHTTAEETSPKRGPEAG